MKDDLDRLELSENVLRRLRKSGISTVDQILAIGSIELSKIESLGRATISGIRAGLNRCGYSWSPEGGQTKLAGIRSCTCCDQWTGYACSLGHPDPFEEGVVNAAQFCNDFIQITLRTPKPAAKKFLDVLAVNDSIATRRGLAAVLTMAAIATTKELLDAATELEETSHESQT